MRRTFNCGVGMALVVDQSEVSTALELLNACNEVAWEIGKISPGKGMVEYI
jgi:phosphoribosylformylglycinamidine cyclo-ligase